MRFAEHEAWTRLAASDHGTLCTVHAERGVDAVPVVFALGPEGHLAVPVDTVKPKSTSRLQRERNLEADPRATLLVDHWDRDDWSRLWWVRAELRAVPEPTADTSESLAASLAERYDQYRGRPFHRLLVFRIQAVTGWSAGEGR